MKIELNTLMAAKDIENKLGSILSINKYLELRKLMDETLIDACELPVTASLRELCKAAHAMAVSKGFWEGHKPMTIEIMGLKLALIHSEVSEALEAARDRKVFAYQVGDKPEGLPSEMADIVLRVADFCEAAGINLEAAIEAKMKYNATRPHKHGRAA